jgi:hypothetical protein
MAQSQEHLDFVARSNAARAARDAARHAAFQPSRPMPEGEFYAAKAKAERDAMQAHNAAHPFDPSAMEDVWGREATLERAAQAAEEERTRRENDPYAWNPPAYTLPPNDPERVEAKRKHFEGK